MPEIKININRCKGCMLCIEVCPKKLIKVSGRINRKGYEFPEFINSEDCTGCAFCAITCPDICIEVYK